MTQINLKTHYTAQELADMQLPGMPETRPGVAARAKNHGWQSRARAGRGGGCEYSIDSLPAETQEAIRERFYRSVLENRSQEVAAREIAKRKAAAQEKGSKLELMRQCPALLAREVQQLTTRQKQIADARAALAMEVEKLRDSGLSRTAAVAYVANNSRNGTLPAHLHEAAKHANARPGSTRTGVGTRSLQEWLTIFETTKPGVERMAMLAPGHLKAKKPEQIKWLPMFLAHWRSLNGPSLREAYAS
ncbi:DNA-binding protein, partial [Raoultella sp. C349492]|uniref:DNA-binding protein n=1 Tax=Raoultella sp. C349492 TaxID=2970253 RepID=UPI0035C6B777